ncbi:hypothetical protein C8R44DRAFT_326230 [Mycena epipterygia]|nr:hypothetical protein C8R44DRAFT_326230 [Mycena epipterygia]
MQREHNSEWPSLQRPTTPTVLQTVLGARRAWKTSSTGENIWPPHLEAALLEGLENYVPDDSRETRVLGRYRGRNQFIAEYIFSKTGVQRSNKQVGSRLQQLRHCSNVPELRRLLSPCPQRVPRNHANDIPIMNIAGEHPLPYAEPPRNILISIPILPQNSPHIAINSSPEQVFNSNYAFQITNHPRHLQSITPTATFLSPNPLSAQSWFSVYFGDQIVHTEVVPLVVLKDEPTQGSGFLHSTSLIPTYWGKIVDSPVDPTGFVILQDVVRHNDSAIVFSAQYRFVYISNSAFGSVHGHRAHTGTEFST